MVDPGPGVELPCGPVLLEAVGAAHGAGLPATVGEVVEDGVPVVGAVLGHHETSGDKDI